jgi:hypothetical protein
MLRAAVRVVGVLAIGFVLGLAWRTGTAEGGQALRSQDRPLGVGTVGRFQMVQGLWASRPAFFMLDTATGLICIHWDGTHGQWEPAPQGKWLPVTAVGTQAR